MTKELEDLSNLHESQILKEKKHVFIFHFANNIHLSPLLPRLAHLSCSQFLQSVF